VFVNKNKQAADQKHRKKRMKTKEKLKAGAALRTRK